MPVFNYSNYTPPGILNPANTRAIISKRNTNSHIQSFSLYSQKTKSKNHFHNVTTGWGGRAYGLKKKGDLYLIHFNDFLTEFSDIISNILTAITENSQDEKTTQLVIIAEGIASGKLTPEMTSEMTRTFYEILMKKHLHDSDIPEVFRELFKKITTSDSRPIIKAITHKADKILIERSNVGRKLSSKKAIPALYEHNDREILTGHTGKKNAKEVIAIVSLNFEKTQEWAEYIPALKRLEPFDMVILTHATTLYDAGNRIISTDMLFRQINGGDIKQTTQAMRREIYDSFCRLGQTWLYIDASEEYKAGLNKKSEFRGALLPCGMVIGDTILNGQKAHDCIKIYDISPLIEYSKAKGQVSSIPLEMLKISGINYTKENIVILHYLYGTFADMRNTKSKRNKNIISYETLYNYLGVEGSNPTQLRTIKARIRTTVRAILSDWAQRGFLKGFQELTTDNKPVRAGAKATKIHIDFPTEKELTE